ncbi:MAG: PIN domain-containing protein [Lachnospiraceae bacterium]|nr:PIN domain-containing protein [Lachnospiraceae bacterium]
MRKLKIYLDTSVISHLQQEDAPEKTQETRELWEQFKHRGDIEIVVSDVVIKEIWQCKEPKRSFMFEKLAQIDYTFVRTTDEEDNLANIYLQNGILKEKSFDDLTHIATAALNGCRYIVSWNFKHFVNPKTIDAVNAANLLLGLPQMNIFSPAMMLGGF